MNKKIVKIVSIALMAIMMVSIAVTSFALTPTDLPGNPGAQGTTEIANVGNNIIGILQVVGIVLSVVVLIIIGIKYMMGSAEEKAEYKKTLMPYVIGAALIFAASAFAQVIYQFFTGVKV